MLAPTTIFNSVCFVHDQHEPPALFGDEHLSNFSQIFFCVCNHVPFGRRGFLRADGDHPRVPRRSQGRQFFVDMWRVVVYMFVPAAFIIGVIFMSQGMPMTAKSSYHVSTLEAGAMGPRTARSAETADHRRRPGRGAEPIKMLGTNGGGFFGMNSAHPFENPTGLSNFVNTMAMMLFPFMLVLMYGRMLGRFRHGVVVFSVMMLMMAGTIVWSIHYDTLKPNPG